MVSHRRRRGREGYSRLAIVHSQAFCGEVLDQPQTAGQAHPAPHPHGSVARKPWRPRPRASPWPSGLQVAPHSQFVLAWGHSRGPHAPPGRSRGHRDMARQTASRKGQLRGPSPARNHHGKASDLGALQALAKPTSQYPPNLLLSTVRRGRQRNRDNITIAVTLP